MACTEGHADDDDEHSSPRLDSYPFVLKNRKSTVRVGDKKKGTPAGALVCILLTACNTWNFALFDSIFKALLLLLLLLLRSRKTSFPADNPNQNR